MKICLVHEEYPEETNFGGIATYQKLLAETLVSLGHTVYVICRGIEKNYNYVENGVNIFRVHVKNYHNQYKNYTIYRRKVANLLKQFQDNNLIDIIEVPDWGAETIFFEKYRKIPLVVRLHTPLKIWLKYNNNDFGKIKKELLKWEEKMLQSADTITCCSNVLKQIMINEFGLKGNDILVIPNPANITDFYLDKNIKKKNKLLFVGSLEERKGVCILAKSLNILFKKIPDLKIDFVGKDTNRNSLNISTRELIMRIVDNKYTKNINFVGHVHNKELNKYFNEAIISIFPSLFDNFPYVVLESMITGCHTIGSRNSGMVEMLKDEQYIYETGDYLSLAEKIERIYRKALKIQYNYRNIARVTKEYNCVKVCKKIINTYENTLQKYYLGKTTTKELQDILFDNIGCVVKSVKEIKKGVANKVFKVDTTAGTYIIKKYLHNYNFELANRLYDIYTKQCIPVIKPINSSLITYNGIKYNIFKYQKGRDKTRKIDYAYLMNIVCAQNRQLNYDDPKILKLKIDEYYNYLLNIEESCTNIPIKHIMNVLSEYQKLQNKKILINKYINHGDISRDNIIVTKKNTYLIDFDEVCISSELYDFAVVIVKFCTKKSKINIKKYNLIKEEIKKYFPKYTEQDYIIIIKYYLCKILLEKFYLHQTGKINLFSRRQKIDNYEKYYILLNTL